MASSHKVHRFKRIVLKSGYVLYMCDLPHCHTQYPTAMIVGKQAICHRCDREFTVTKDRLRGATRIFCRLCIRRKTEIELPPIPEIMP